MDGEACDHDVVTDGRVLVAMRGGGRNTAARGLEKQRGNVAGDEDAWVGKGFDARVFGPEGDDDAGEAEIDTRG